MRLVALVSLAGAVLVAAGCGGSSATTLHIVSEDATSRTTVIDTGAKGKSPGDVYAFDARLYDSGGTKQIGHLYGTQTSIMLEPGAEVVQSLITLDLGDGDSVTVGGISRYPRGDVGLIPGKQYARPVLGGTGKYEGATGEDSTTRRPDGRYEHTIHLTG